MSNLSKTDRRLGMALIIARCLHHLRQLALTIRMVGRCYFCAFWYDYGGKAPFFQVVILARTDMTTQDSPAACNCLWLNTQTARSRG